MATNLHTEEDSDEEWQRIADAVGEFEAQYTATRNTPAATNLHARHISWNTNQTSLQPTAAQPVPSVTLATPPASFHDVDPYSRALRDKDEAIRLLRLEREGEVSNYRHKIRALQNELMAVRATPRPQPASQLQVERRLTQITQEKERIARELAAMQHEAHHTKEKLMYAEQELLTARDRERAHVAALNKRPAAAAAPPPPLSNQQFPVTVAKDVVPGTQVPMQQLTQHDSPSSSLPNDIVDGTQPKFTQQVRPTQKFEMARTAVRPPTRRRRRSSSDDVNSAYVSAACSTPSSVPTTAATSSAAKADLAEEHGWGTQLHTDWQNDALRARLFGGQIGHKFLQLSSGPGCERLRSAISQAMASGAWTTLLRPLVAVCSAGRAPTLVSLKCLEALMTFCEDCRREADGIAGDIADILQTYGERHDFEIVGACCRVLQAADAARHIRRCDLLRWALGTVEDTRYRKARLSALELLEDTTCRILEESLETGSASDEERELDWEFVEQVYSSAASRVNNGAWSGRELGIVVSMLVRAACLSPYMLADTGGVQGLANAFICAVHCVRMNMLRERERLDTLCELIERPGVGENSGGENPWESDLGDVRKDIALQESVGVAWTCALGLLQVGLRLGHVDVCDGTRCVLLEGLAVIGWPRGSEMTWETATPRILVNDGIGEVCRRVFGIVKRGKL